MIYPSVIPLLGYYLYKAGLFTSFRLRLEKSPLYPKKSNAKVEEVGTHASLAAVKAKPR